MLAAPGADRFGLYGTAGGISSGAHPQGPGQWPPPVGAPLVHVGSVTGGSGWVFLGADALAHPSGSSGHWTDPVYGLGRCEVAGRTFRPADGP